MRLAIILLLAAAAALVCAQDAQQASPFPSSGRGGGTANDPTVPQGERAPRMTFPGDPSGRANRQAIFYTGTVVTQEGTPPPEPANILYVCGSRRTVASTDKKGRFSISVGNGGSPNNGGFGNAGVDSSVGRSDPYLGCELRASLDGYSPNTVDLTTHGHTDGGDLGIITLRRIGGLGDVSYSASTYRAPKSARGAYEKALTSIKKKRYEDARRELERAVTAYPNYALAWCELGIVYRVQGRNADALEAFKKAVAADNRIARPYLQLGSLAVAEKRWRDAVDATEHAIHLNSIAYPLAFLLNALGNYNLRNFQAAESSAREAVSLDGTHRYPVAQQLLGVILWMRRDFRGAAENLRAYLQYAPQATDAAIVRSELAQVEARLRRVPPGRGTP